MLNRPISEMFNSIFAVSYRKEIEVSQSHSLFHHCSTVCPYKDGVVLAFYSGTGECQDDQGVYVTYFKNNNYADLLKIGDKTGNPVLFSSANHCFLIWSKFEDTGPLRSIVDRWKHCSLWIQKIDVADGITLVGQPHQISSPQDHLLGRCLPICIANQALYQQTQHTSDYLLPLYDEVARNLSLIHI